MARSAPLLFALAMAIASSDALAEEIEPLRFGYSAPPICPDGEAFVKDVHARTTRFEIVGAGDDLRSFSVRIVPQGGEFLGEMRVVDRRGQLTVRTVSAARCDEVASALAFITSISIDPKASATPPPPAPPSSPSPPAPDPSTPSAPPSVEPPAVISPAPARADASVETPPVAPAPHGWRRNGWHLTAGVAASAQGLGAPSAVIGDSVFLGIAIDTNRLFSPEVRLAVTRASSGNLDAGPGHANLTWTVAHVEACPVRWPARGSLDFRPCAEGDLGALAAVTVGVPRGQSRTRPWGALGGLARVEWVPFEPLVLGAEVSLSAPLVREVFFVAPTPAVYQAPAVVAEGGLALGMRFP
jgi:hypothetical protein